MDDPWLTRQEVADRERVPLATVAQWAHKGTGPRYALFGRHSRYRLSDVIAWEEAQFAGDAA
jgi:excisionase family DNA binding protein